MKEILEHIAKSLEDIASTLKTQQTERQTLMKEFNTMQEMLKDLRIILLALMKILKKRNSSFDLGCILQNSIYLIFEINFKLCDCFG